MPLANEIKASNPQGYTASPEEGTGWTTPDGAIIYPKGAFDSMGRVAPGRDPYAPPHRRSNLFDAAFMATAALIGGGAAGQFSGAGAGAGGGASAAAGGSSMGWLSDLFFGPGAGAGSAGAATAGAAGGIGSWLPGVLGIGSGLFGMNEAKKLRGMNADPFGSQRGYYQQQLAELQANPNRVTDIPGYKFGIEQGLTGRQRALASGGYSGSGNEIIALEQYAQDYAGRYYNSEVTRLAGLAGANISPNFQPQFEAADLYRESLGDIGGGLGRIFNRSSQPTR